MYCQQDDDEFQSKNQLASTRASKGNPAHICIVGGGFGGLYTALSLQRSHPFKSQQYRITLIEQRDHFLFTPLLYEVVTGELHPWEVAPSYQKLLARSRIQICRSQVQDVDLSHRHIHLDDGRRLSYDYLVLTVGSEPRRDWVPGAVDYAQSFRTLADAQHLKERLRFLVASDCSMIRVAIAGAGPNGVEIACKLADRLQHRGEIHLIDRSDGILKTFSKGSQIAAYRALAKRGVQLHLETRIGAIAPDSITLAVHDQEQQQHILKTDLVLWTAGTQIADWVQRLECDHNSQGQVIGTTTLQLAGYPEVFVLGDLADVHDASGQRVPAMAQVAFQQAPHTAKNLQRAIAGRPLRPFRYLHLGEMLTLGIQAAVVSSFGITLSGRLAHIIRRGVYIQRLPTLKHASQVAWRWLTDGIKRLWWARSSLRSSKGLRSGF